MADTPSASEFLKGYTSPGQTPVQAADSPTPSASDFLKNYTPAGVATQITTPGSDTVLGTLGYVGQRALQGVSRAWQGAQGAFGPFDTSLADLSGAPLALPGPVPEPGPPPNALGRYGGAVAEAVGANPLLTMVAPEATVGGALAGQGAQDLGAPPWAQVGAGLVGGVAGAVPRAVVGAVRAPGALERLAAGVGKSETAADAAAVVQGAAKGWMEPGTGGLARAEQKVWAPVDAAIPRTADAPGGPPVAFTQTEAALKSILKTGAPSSVQAVAKGIGGGVASRLWNWLTNAEEAPATVQAPAVAAPLSTSIPTIRAPSVPATSPTPGGTIRTPGTAPTTISTPTEQLLTDPFSNQIAEAGTLTSQTVPGASGMSLRLPPTGVATPGVGASTLNPISMATPTARSVPSRTLRLMPNAPTTIPPLAWDMARQLRSYIGEGMSDATLKSMGQKNLDRLYGALTDDLRATAAQHGATEAFDNANATSSALRTVTENHIAPLAEAAPDKVYSTAMAGTGPKGGGDRLAALRTILGDTPVNELAGVNIRTPKWWAGLSENAKAQLVPDPLKREVIDNHVKAIISPPKPVEGIVGSIAGGELAPMDLLVGHLGLPPDVARIASGVAVPLALTAGRHIAQNPFMLRQPLAGALAAGANAAGTAGTAGTNQ